MRIDVCLCAFTNHHDPRRLSERPFGHAEHNACLQASLATPNYSFMLQTPEVGLVPLAPRGRRLEHQSAGAISLLHHSSFTQASSLAVLHWAGSRLLCYCLSLVLMLFRAMAAAGRPVSVHLYPMAAAAKTVAELLLETAPPSRSA